MSWRVPPSGSRNQQSPFLYRPARSIFDITPRQRRTVEETSGHLSITRRDVWHITPPTTLWERIREGKVLKFLSDTSLRLSFCLAHRDESRGSGGGGLMSYLWHRRQVNVPYLSFFLIPISPLLLRWCIQGYNKLNFTDIDGKYEPYVLDAVES